MEIETLQKIKKIKEKLYNKLKKDKKNFRWFWEHKVLKTGLVYSSFMGCLNGNGGNIRGDIETIIDEYVGEKF